MIEILNEAGVSTLNEISGSYRAGKTETYTNQYGTWEVQNVTDKVMDKGADVSSFDISTFTKYEKSFAQLRSEQSSCYTSSALLKNSATSAGWQQISSGMDAAITDYFNGDLSDEALSEKMQSLSAQLEDICGKAGYPNVLAANDKGSRQVMADTLYSEFRMRILSEAVKRNNSQGKEYTTGQWDSSENAMRTYTYYNSEYYYQSQAAIAAITDGVMAIAQERGWEDFQIRDYMTEGLNMYANFNTAFSNNMNIDEQWILDPSIDPPRNFEWFYETGGSQANQGVITASWQENPDGTRTYTYIRGLNGFDPNDQRTGRTWAAYTDSNGERHEVSAEFYFERSQADLKNVSSLLNFAGSKGTAAINSFLKNLQLYPKNYFSSLLAGHRVDLYG